MNFHTTKTVTKPRKRAGKKEENGLSFFIILRIFVIGIMLFGIMTYRISLKNKAEEMNRRATEILQDTHRLNREIAHLKIRKESLSSWKYINKRINQFKLSLRPPKPFQVRELMVVDNSIPKMKAERKRVAALAASEKYH